MLTYAVFRMDSKQSQIFEGVSHLVQSAVDGFNVCIFAYGQTGSGKISALLVQKYWLYKY
jgi:hypothetical protein